LSLLYPFSFTIRLRLIGTDKDTRKERRRRKRPLSGFGRELDKNLPLLRPLLSTPLLY
jgi:hypothetical protein